ncbi:hypothetical protein [Ureibacillus endophyticus]|uniref:Uncharacterized protein n=1 Tax=Ureibacillus endophyticus TaxID=1978490 RepID=A0A494Z4R4_9BACL|nr:hypothetical protein [Lysinibacillus endophyticus]RKQ17498.1 hypothetical protein D8M03_07865 [Lysinibacillus endophyticus]
MEIKLLKPGYKNNEQFYRDFLEDKIISNDDYFSNEIVTIANAPDFPIYIAEGTGEEKKQSFRQAFQVMASFYINTDRDLHLDELFWHSLLVTKKREYILENYPDVTTSFGDFKNIVVKSFDWQNYIYKCVLAVEYIEDYFNNAEEKDRYYNLVLENLDLYNYIIKYSIFRNAEFLIKILTIIDELDISGIMKAKIKDRPDLGTDERYGRRVIFELNKNYPVIMSPLLDIDSLKQEVIQALSYYYDVSEIRKNMLQLEHS